MSPLDRKQPDPDNMGSSAYTALIFLILETGFFCAEKYFYYVIIIILLIIIIIILYFYAIKLENFTGKTFVKIYDP